eukprot:SM000055S18233  [mRNA]  locus=s55:152359:155928:- [translate_table: standard]
MTAARTHRTLCATSSTSARSAALTTRCSWSHQVFVLENVYVNWRGQAFNATYRFDRLGCGGDQHFAYTPGSTRVYEFDELVNLAYWNGGQFYHGIVELLPTYLLLHGFLARRPDVPIVQRQMQIDFYVNTLQHFIGVPTSATNFKIIRNGELFFARRLVQPIFQWSARPSKAVWRLFRSENLVRRDGLPMFFANWTKRFPSAPLSPPAEWTGGSFDTEVQQPPPPAPPPPPPPPDDADTDDWVVIYAIRETTRVLTESEEVHAALKDAFSSERVVVFDGRLPVKDAKLLFHRARLIVGVHGAAFTNMVFMPTNSSVLEIRPRDYRNSCYHHLAEVCELRYYLLLADGNKDSPTSVDVADVVQVLNTVAPIVLRSSGAS